MLLSLSSLITRDIFIIKTSYYYRTKLLVHRTQWCKNMNFEKCTIMLGFHKSGHIYYAWLWMLFLDYLLFKPGTCSLQPRAPGFFEIALACMSVCLCVSAPKTINNQWRDMVWYIGCVQLVTKVSQLSPTFNYFIWHLPLIKWMGMAILTQHVVNTCQRKLRWCGTSYKRTTRKTECSIYK